MRELLLILWARRLWIVACLVLFGACFALAGFLMTPVYRASAVIVSAGSERSSLGSSLNGALGSLGGLASLVGVGLGPVDSATEESLAVLRSQRFTEAFIQDYGLLPILYARKWDRDKKSWKVPKDKKSGLIAVQVDWQDRELAAQWVNEMIDRLNAELRNRALTKAAASLGYLQKELSNTSDIGERNAISHLIEIQIQQRMLATVTPDYAFRVVDGAMVPDRRDVLRPKKLMLILTGLMLGLIVGVIAVALKDSLSASTQR
jgi:uncharacterized protein involved in exopolysaccharide biosynthesis